MTDQYGTKDDVRNWWLGLAKTAPDTTFHLYDAWNEPDAKQKADLFDELEKLGYLERITPSRDTRYVLTGKGKDFVKTVQAV
ncbi:hypothetical protein ACFLSF_02765 [Candidatus Bipolaricaulota bacterium]